MRMVHNKSSSTSPVQAAKALSESQFVALLWPVSFGIGACFALYIGNPPLQSLTYGSLAAIGGVVLLLVYRRVSGSRAGAAGYWFTVATPSAGVSPSLPVAEGLAALGRRLSAMILAACVIGVSARLIAVISARARPPE
jgi:hypothetical protein